jgi:hypothetical protein
VFSLLFLILGCHNTQTEIQQNPAASKAEVKDSASDSGLVEYTTIRLGSWAVTPNIEICSGSPVSKKKIISAFKWWSNISSDYEYGEVVVNSDCSGQKIRPGWIQFKQASKWQLENMECEAYAFIGYDKQGAINRSLVFLDASNDKWIVRHEIGHAFGWDHVPEDQRGHLMNEYVGKNIDGLSVYTLPSQNRSFARQ